MEDILQASTLGRHTHRSGKFPRTAPTRGRNSNWSLMPAIAAFAFIAQIQQMILMRGGQRLSDDSSLKLLFHRSLHLKQMFSFS